jgi:hypothetical protein
MKQQNSRCGVTESREGMEIAQRKGSTDKYWFNNRCREERNE